MSEISPIPASQFKAEAQRGGGSGGGPSLTKILVIIGALVLLITTIIVLLWDPSVRPTHQFNEGCQLSILLLLFSYAFLLQNTCDRLQRGKLLAMGMSGNHHFDAVDATFRGLSAPHSNLVVGQELKNTSVLLDESSWAVEHLAEWAATNLTSNSSSSSSEQQHYFSTGFLFEHRRGTMVAVISDDRQWMAITVLRIGLGKGPVEDVHTHPYSERPVAVHLPPGVTFLTVGSYSLNPGTVVAFYNATDGMVRQTSVDHLLRSADGTLPPEQ